MKEIVELLLGDVISVFKGMKYPFTNATGQ